MGLKGTVNWFKEDYGFINPDDGDGDVFVHITKVKESNLEFLFAGQRVEFELVKGKTGKRGQAKNISVLA